MSNNVLISQSEFAKLMNVSKQAVSKAIKQGRITQVIDKTDGKLKLNADMAAAEWRKSTEPRVENSRMAPNFRPQNSSDPESPEGEDDDEEGGSLFQAKAQTEKYRAKLLKLEFKEKTGELISAEKAKREAFKLGRLIRDAILNVPSQICNELAVETDPFKVHGKLTHALTKALEMMVEEAQKLEPSAEELLDEEDQEELEDE